VVALLIILGLILLNGFFVAAEFAIVGVPRAVIERRATRGDRAALQALEILQHPPLQDRFVATAQVGITLASLGLGMYGEHQMAATLAGWLESLGPWRLVAAHAIASILAVAILTYLHIVLGEMVPKALALREAERIVIAVTRPMIWINALFYPLVAVLNGLANGCLNLVGINRQVAGGEHFHTAEELQFIVQESREGGMLRAEFGKVLLDLFRFGDLTADEVMVPRVKVNGIPQDADPMQLAEILGTARHTRYPVYEGDLDHIKGIVHLKDLLHRLIDGLPLGIDQLRPVPYVPETALVNAVLEVMQRERTQMVVVMDEFGGTAGIITMEDLFEEVVGDIEEGTGRQDIFRDQEGRLHAAGGVRIDEVGESLGLVLEHPEVDTVGGLVLSLLGGPAQVGDQVIYDDVKFQVTALEGLGVKECLVVPLKPPIATGK